MSADSRHDARVTAWAPDLLLSAVGRFERGRALVSDARGSIAAVVPLGGAVGDEEIARAVSRALGLPAGGVRVARLAGRALLPGMVNAHSHAFQRVIRGRTEHRSAASRDSFWTWREMMYAAAERLTPEGVYDASRMAFLEMAAGGITTVGEFHYLHRAADGRSYDDPNLLAKEVIRAARDVGVRIALLRVAYARAGFNQPPHERQRRFVEPDPQVFVADTEALIEDLARDAAEASGTGGGTGAGHRPAWVGVAPHSVRAVGVEHLRAARDLAAARCLPVHAHVAEQPAEVEACLAETGRTPVEFLAAEGLITSEFTAVHAVHVSPAEIGLLARAGAFVCACPTTERNLGDGVVPADALLEAGVGVALGTDSHAQIDLLEDARELEYHLRLVRLARNVLAPGAGAGDDETRPHPASALAARLFDCATAAGARSVGLKGGGALAAGSPADFFTVDLEDPTVAGAGDEDLLACVVFSLSRAAVREVAVGGRLVVEGGRHAAQEETVARFAALQRELWS
ncbi:MAG TPA: formimidoylglutamate deiminase [Pyrinomonadaceae bacterium]|nr:formimidoylglutamate deiminase [Pyrinomonadaceae bacterium]